MRTRKITILNSNECPHALIPPLPPFRHSFQISLPSQRRATTLRLACLNLHSTLCHHHTTIPLTQCLSSPLPIRRYHTPPTCHIQAVRRISRIQPMHCPSSHTLLRPRTRARKLDAENKGINQGQEKRDMLGGEWRRASLTSRCQFAKRFRTARLTIQRTDVWAVSETTRRTYLQRLYSLSFFGVLILFLTPLVKRRGEGHTVRFDVLAVDTHLILSASSC